MIEILPETSEKLCQKCSTNKASILNRKESMCNNCFNRTVSGKLRKLLQAEIYKVSNKNPEPHKVLVAYNGNTSTVACLNMLLDLLQTQVQATGKQGFEIVVLTINEISNEQIKNQFKALNEHYSDSTSKFKYRIVDVASVLLGRRLQRLNIDKKFNIHVEQSSREDKSFSIDDIIQLIPDKSSLQDFMEIIYQDIIMTQAKELECGTIIYGHSMTKLSSISLSNIIKGRGSSVASKINDIDIDGIHIKHPVRELFDNELEYYNQANHIAHLVFQQQHKLLSTINKNLTVNQLTDKYLQQIELNGYSSTIPTVVKISEKLTTPTKFVSDENPICEICHQVIYQSPKAWLNKITETEPAELQNEEEKNYFRQYEESLQGGKINKYSYKPAEGMEICYGCMVSMNRVGDDGILWPVEKDEAVLQEYIIDEDE